MPPRTRKRNPTMKAAAMKPPPATPTSAKPLIISRSDGLPPERPKAYAFLQRKAAHEASPPDVPVASPTVQVRIPMN
jgi:hypothetical protein